MKKTIEQTFIEHLRSDEIFQEKMNRVLFGDDETDYMGMKDKVDEMHEYLTSLKHIKGFVGGFGSTLKWLLIIGAAIGLVKGWWIGIIEYIISYK